MRYFGNQRRLKNLFINRDIQPKLVLTNLTYIFLIVVVIISAILAPFYSDMSRSSELFDQHLSASIFIILIERLFIAVIVILVLSFIHQIFISHRFCGPLVNFRKTFKKISQGDLTRKVSLRPHDFLKDEAIQVNEMIDSLSGFISTLREDLDGLFEILDKIQSTRADQKELEVSLKIARHQAQACTEHLSKIKIEMKSTHERGQFAETNQNPPVELVV